MSFVNKTTTDPFIISSVNTKRKGWKPPAKPIRTEQSIPSISRPPASKAKRPAKEQSKLKTLTLVERILVNVKDAAKPKPEAKASAVPARQLLATPNVLKKTKPPAAPVPRALVKKPTPTLSKAPVKVATAAATSATTTSCLSQSAIVHGGKRTPPVTTKRPAHFFTPPTVDPPRVVKAGSLRPPTSSPISKPVPKNAQVIRSSSAKLRIPISRISYTAPPGLSSVPKTRDVGVETMKPVEIELVLSSPPPSPPLIQCGCGKDSNTIIDSIPLSSDEDVSAKEDTKPAVSKEMIDTAGAKDEGIEATEEKEAVQYEPTEEAKPKEQVEGPNFLAGDQKKATKKAGAGESASKPAAIIAEIRKRVGGTGNGSDDLVDELRARMRRRATGVAAPCRPSITATAPTTPLASAIINLVTRSPPIPLTASPTSETSDWSLKKAAPGDGYETEIIITAFGSRRVRKLVIPPLTENSPPPSRDTRIQEELKSLRAQKKVAGPQVASPEGERLSLRALSIIEKVKEGTAV